MADAFDVANEVDEATGADLAIVFYETICG
jgi:hypothetical protein